MARTVWLGVSEGAAHSCVRNRTKDNTHIKWMALRHKQECIQQHL